jgi:hypothetical protein
MLEEIADRIIRAQELLGEVARIDDEQLPDDNEICAIAGTIREAQAEHAKALELIEQMQTPTPPVAIPLDQRRNCVPMTKERPTT